MKKTATSSPAGAVAVAVAATLLAGLGLLWGARAAGWVTFSAKKVDVTVEQADDDLLGRRPATLLCELRQSVPVDGFDAPMKDSRINVLAGVDLKGHTGWYQGDYSLSENRKGSLVEEGSLLQVSRPALYERHGAMIARESFTLDRRTGEFLQTLLLQDGRRFDLLRGYCGVLSKAPF